MKLYVTPTSPFARMVRIVIMEKRLDRRVEIIRAQTRTPDSPYYSINPFGRGAVACSSRAFANARRRGRPASTNATRPAGSGAGQGKTARRDAAGRVLEVTEGIIGRTNMHRYG